MGAIIQEFNLTAVGAKKHLVLRASLFVESIAEHISTNDNLEQFGGWH